MLPPMLHPREKYPMASRIVAALLAVFAAALLGGLGCSEKIGDACEYNVDCSKQGERLCDRSSPGGYCTIENCNAEICPDEAKCIAFYPVAFLIQPCNPDSEDDPEADVPTNECTPDEICISSGFCAPKASSRRYCMLKCDKDDDCRDGYECRRTGMDGAEYVTPIGDTRTDKYSRFCAPKR